MTMMHKLTKIVLTHEQQLHNIRSQDSFVLFFNHEDSGALPVLVKAATQWRQEMEKDTHLYSLKTHLLHTLLLTLKQRLTQLQHQTEGQALRDTLIQKHLMLGDLSWPFQKWNPKDHKMVLDQKKTAITMKGLWNVLEELIDLVSKDDQLQRFHALAPLTPEYQTKHQITPWRLQLNLREQSLYNLLWRLSHNTVWHLVGAQMKPHSQTMGGPAKDLQRLIQPKGKGKGKGKGSSTTTSNPSTMR